MQQKKLHMPVRQRILDIFGFKPKIQCS